MSVYADTSFLVSLYVLDANSAKAAAQMARTPLPILITSFGELELVNSISLRLFRKELIASRVKAARALIAKDIETGVLVVKPMPQLVYERAKQMARRRTPQLGTRTLDVVHVASALILQAHPFLTFDRNQGRLAEVEGLVVP